MARQHGGRHGIAPVSVAAVLTELVLPVWRGEPEGSLATFVDRYHLGLALVALLAGAVVAAPDRRLPAVSRRAVGLAALVGALLGGRGIDGAVIWCLFLALVAALPDRGEPPHVLEQWAVPFALVSLVGIWTAVPDTEPPLALACALAPVALAWVVRKRSVGPVGTAALVAGVVGAVWVGSAGRTAVLVSVVALGMVAIAPLVSLGRQWHPSGQGWIVLGVVHAVVALGVPRQLLDVDVPTALLWGLAAVTAEVVVAVGVSRSSSLAVRSG